MKRTFEYEFIETNEELLKIIGDCEGSHIQQVVYSTYHNALTQVCFGCAKVRSTNKDL